MHNVQGGHALDREKTDKIITQLKGRDIKGSALLFVWQF